MAYKNTLYKCNVWWIFDQLLTTLTKKTFSLNVFRNLFVHQKALITTFYPVFPNNKYGNWISYKPTKINRWFIIINLGLKDFLYKTKIQIRFSMANSFNAHLVWLYNICLFIIYLISNCRAKLPVIVLSFGKRIVKDRTATTKETASPIPEYITSYRIIDI